MRDIELAQQELTAMGIESQIEVFPGMGNEAGNALVFDYPVEVGKYKGQKFRMAISFKEVGYPEYPPHFVHVCEAAPFEVRPHKVHESGGKTWNAYSLLPNDIWDMADMKDMRFYFETHLRRIWEHSCGELGGAHDS